MAPVFVAALTPGDHILADVGHQLAPLLWGGTVFVLAVLIAILGLALRELRPHRSSFAFHPERSRIAPERSRIALPRSGRGLDAAA